MYIILLRDSHLTSRHTLTRERERGVNCKSIPNIAKLVVEAAGDIQLETIES